MLDLFVSILKAAFAPKTKARQGRSATNQKEPEKLFPVGVVGMEHRENDVAKAFRPRIRKLVDDFGATDPTDLEDVYEDVEIRVQLVLEDDNPHDKNAVAVFYGKTQIGYLPAKMAPHFRAWAKANHRGKTSIACKAEAELPLFKSKDIAVDVMLPKLMT